MGATKRNARVAGMLYLLLFPAALNLIYVPRTMIVSGDAAATAANIAAHERLFRLGIVSGLFSAVGFIFLVLALHRLLKEVNPHLAALMVVMAVVSVPITFANELNNLAALALASGADFLSVLPTEQRHAMVMFSLRLHDYGTTVNSIFWGLWLFPFGLLVYRSRFLPRVLGVWLMVNCFGWLASGFTDLLLPAYSSVVSVAVMPAIFGEFAIVLWLLIKGASDQPSGATASSTAAV